MTRLAAFLRRWADRIDPPAPAVSVPAMPAVEATSSDADLFGPPEFGPLAVTRERQEERLVELQFLLDKIALHDSGSGLLWLETWQLEVLRRYVEHELRLRERRFDLVEKHWRP